MNDLISRQAAIDALNEYFARIGKLKRRGLTKGEKAISLDTVGVIKTMPSAQPNVHDFPKDADCISRQQAIDAVLGVIPDDDYWKEQVKKAVFALPSAQPEIIRCKDCIHKYDHDCPIDWDKTDSDFCSFAERRTDE